jgi:uncharacterized protein (TIGR00297 family)
LTGDFILLAELGLLVLASVGLSLALRRAGMSRLFSRKLLHLVAIGSIALGLFQLENPRLIMWITAAVYPLLFWLVSKKQFQHEDTRPAWGILWFPPAMFVVWACTGSAVITAVSMAVLAVSDAMAALVGASLNRMEFRLTADKKSIPGSLTFFLSAFGLLSGFKHFGFIQSSDAVLLMAALCGMLLEAMGSAGRDNFFVPVGVALALQAPDHLLLTIGVWLLLPICYLFYKRAWLSASGAVAVWCLASGIISFAGPWFLLPPLLFLIAGTLLGKLPGKKAQDEKQGKARDHIQVWSNGGVALCALWLGGQYGQLLFLISIAISCADTCSSEWGTRFGKTTWNPISFKQMPGGESGGMSLAGTLVAIPAAALIALFAWNTKQFVWITLAGFAGMWLDSILGALVQVKYISPQGTVSEISGPGLQVHSGWRFVNNDVVNISANALTTASMALLLNSIAS